VQGIEDWGIGVILWLQQFSPALDLPFRAFTGLGTEVFFVLFLPLLYWCLDRRIGARLAVIFLLSSIVNAAAKEWAAQPRPFEYDPRVRQLSEATGGGLPSGHTQSAVVVWGYLASQYKRTWLWLLAALLVVFIPLSRLYLGVHFPQDLLAGYVLGVALLLPYIWLEPHTEIWLAKFSLFWQLAAALLVPALLLVLFRAGDEAVITPIAVLMGMGPGIALERRFVGFEPGGAWAKKALRLLLGICIIAALYLGAHAAFSGLEPELLSRLVRYSVIGLFTTFGAPWLFVRLRLAEGRLGT